MARRIANLLIIIFISQCVKSFALSPEQRVFEEIARDLVPQFEKSTSSWGTNLQNAIGFGSSPSDKTIAVWPFNPQEIPVPENIARRWSRLLEAEIVRSKGEATRVVTRKALKTLIAEQQTISAFEQIENPTAKLAKNAKVAALAIGDIRPEGEDYLISYQIIGVQTGTILAASREYRMSVDVADASRAERTMPLDAALQSAIEHFADQNLPIENLELDAVRDSRTKAVTDFGNFVTETFSHGYAEQLALRLPEFRLRVSSIIEQPPATTRFTTYRTEQPETTKPNQYRFEGNYWRLGKNIDLRLSLTSPEGEKVAWSGKIDIRSVPVSLLDYSSKASRFGTSFRDKGPIGLKISTNKGRNPSYRIGERMVIWVETQEDAYLSCFYIQADGVGFKIYPNRFLSKAPISTSEKKGFIKGGEAVEIPGSNANFAFDIQPPTGREDIHCFATDRDVSEELPREIGARDLEPIRQRDLNNLTNFFRELPAIRISESLTTVSISR